MSFRAIATSTLFLAGAAFAEPIAQPHLQVELVLADSSLQAGRPSQIAVRFDVEAGWHIYWKNPGDSGKPPTVHWELPPGYSAGEWAWPVPGRIPFGRLMNYGYDRRALLATPLSVPAGAPKGEVTLGAHVEWLVCAEECIPGKLDLRLRVPMKETPPESSGHVDLFRAASQNQPIALPETWKVRGWVDSREILLGLGGFPVLGETAFIPEEPRVIENAAPQKLTRQGDGLQLALRRSDQSSSNLNRLKGLLITGGKGYAIDLPLSPKPTELPHGLVATLTALLLVIGGGYWYWRRPPAAGGGPRRNDRRPVLGR